jgi:replicative DNA helicase
MYSPVRFDRAVSIFSSSTQGETAMRPDGNVMDRLPPHNRDAERSLLSSMLRDNLVIPEAVNLVRADHFYVYAHQMIFDAIAKLNDDQGKAADIVTVAEYLLQNKLIEEVGGMPYLMELWDAAPSAAHFRHYADIIRQKAIVRSLIHTCNELQADAYDQSQPPTELLDSAERKILEIAEMGLTGDTITVQEAIKEAYDRIDVRKQHGENQLSGIATGFIDLDNLTAGFQNSELIIIAARPSVGKTAYSLCIARHVAVEEQLPVLFVSLEQARVELAERLLCCQARVDSHRLRRGHLTTEDMQKIFEAGDILSNAKLFIDDTPGQNMLRISANARRLKKKHNLRLVIIDYLQLIEPDDRRESRQEQVSGISRRLKFLARELKVPVVALAQVNRSSEDRQDHRPRLSDLRESGAIEQDSDTVLMLHRPDYHEPGQQEGLVEVIVAKQRNGPTGEVSLMYVKQFMRFENFAVEHSNTFGGG